MLQIELKQLESKSKEDQEKRFETFFPQDKNKKTSTHLKELEELK